MKKFNINCDFGGQIAPFTFWIGKPEDGHHALHNQAKWLTGNRGGMVPPDVMDAISQLQELSKKNGVALDELCVYALGTEKDQEALEQEEKDFPEEQTDENSNELQESKQSGDSPS